MKERGLSRLYTAWLIGVLLAIAIADVRSEPDKGPNITALYPVNATALKVSWKKLSKNDSNGEIINYEMCYHVGTTKPDCSWSKNASEVENGVLTRLEPATEYAVAIRAYTEIGSGSLGMHKSNKTNEAKPDKGPNVTALYPVNATALKVSWKNLSKEDSNGEIINYEMCYHVGTTKPDCSWSKNASEVENGVLTGLEPATEYAVAIRAYTKIGSGSLGMQQSNKTNEAKPDQGPNITALYPVNATALKVSWKNLSKDDSNGEIINYEMCYHVGTTKPDCSRSVNASEVENGVLTDLKPATEYAVAIRAYTKIGSGPLGMHQNNKTKETKPAKGPRIISIIPMSSKVLQVNWDRLDKKDSNGNVTGYLLCYEENTLSKAICKINTKVLGVDNTTFNLTNLNEATLYFVAVQAGTKEGFGPEGEVSNGTTLEDRPSHAADFDILVESSESLYISWQPLNRSDANGRITRYSVCYKPKDSTADICAKNESVNGDVLNKTLKGLKKYTVYEVAVRVSTIIGFGPVGRNKSARTLADIPGKPIIHTPHVFFVAIKLSWSEPFPFAGPIQNYTVCWESKNVQKLCNNTSNLNYTIEFLTPGTTYKISISASTVFGEGESSVVTKTTLVSGINHVVLNETSGTSVSDAKTQIGFLLPNLKADESREIKYVYVIVKPKPTKDDKSQNGQSKLLATPQSELRSYGELKNNEGLYIAKVYEGYPKRLEVIVGDDQLSPSRRRKRRNAVSYRNAPLSENTEYAIFVRVFYDEEGERIQNSAILFKKTADEVEGTTGVNSVVIAVVIVVVIIAILVVIFGFLLLRRRKARSDYDGIHLEPAAKPFVRYPIPIADFREHCDRLGMNTGLGYQEEYENVRPKGPVSTEIAKRDENLDKNRYNNIHAYDDSRVILAQIDGEEGSDYINANHIDGFERKNQFIAAQGTLKNTIVDFWRMIWEQKVSSIVMLANPIEKGREKLAVYWPQDRAVKHGPFMIKLDGEVELADYVIRKMTVTMDDVKETRQLTQFHYTVWPDHGVPQYTTSLQAFLTRIRKFVKADSNPFVVHCSAGVGRTGTFIGIFAMLDMIEATKTVDIYNFVCQMRTQRTHMVQVESQYVFLHKAVLEAIECGDTEINAPDLRVKMIQLNRTDPDNPDETMMEKQFKVLEKYTFVKSNTEEGKKPFNVDKNRNKSIIPYEDTRVSLLKSPGVDGSDYINASSIDSYQVRGMYIATQFPLENTVNEFWRMIWEKKSNCIVMLANVDEDPDAFKKYWTDKSNDAMLCGNLLVTLDNEEKGDEYITRNFKLKKNEGGETRDIWHFNFLAWTEEKMPKKTAGVRQMIGKIQDVQRQGGNNPIVVHCSDGGGRTGAFCALVTSLERVKQDQSFNLFQTIMLQRIQRPKMVTSVEQYRFCFQAILDFLDSFDQYANFQDLRQ